MVEPMKPLRRYLPAVVFLLAAIAAFLGVQRCVAENPAPATGPCVTVEATNDNLVTCPDPRHRRLTPDLRTVRCECPATGSGGAK